MTDIFDIQNTRTLDALLKKDVGGVLSADVTATNVFSRTPNLRLSTTYEQKFSKNFAAYASAFGQRTENRVDYGVTGGLRWNF